jgi:hypothetical protein
MGTLNQATPFLGLFSVRFSNRHVYVKGTGPQLEIDNLLLLLTGLEPSAAEYKHKQG